MASTRKKGKRKPTTTKRTAKAKHRAPVAPTAGMTRTLTQLEANPGSPELVAQARADIERHGLQAFFDAAAKTPGSRQARKAEALQEKLAATTAVPVERGLLFPPRGDEPQLRQTWKDCVAARIVQPLAIFRPTTLDELRSVLRQASANGCRVKAVGSGHSFADVASTTDFLIETHGLNDVLDLERDTLRPGTDINNLFAAEGGMRVRDLNEALWDAGFSLINMGGYDGQTIMGVMSTSTHGSGIEFPPLAHFVASLTTVVSHGRTIRIEPRDGITDPATWAAKHPDIELVQDDDWFNAVQVGIGCMGVVYSVVLRVQPRYWMFEQRGVTTWRELKPRLRDGAPLRDNRHWEVLISPYEVNGEHTCLITRRNPVDQPARPSHESLQRNFIVELLAKARFSSAVLLSVINHFPDLLPQLIEQALRTLAGEYVDRSYRVFNIGAANEVPAYGSEIGFTMNTYIAATDRILGIAGKAQRLGKAYLTSPFSLRFCKSSPAFMSMMFEADTCMIEFPMLANTVGGYELLRRIENEMYALGGRPHWGLLNFISGGQQLIRQMYSRFDTWDAVRRQLDPDDMFANSFTDRAGITAPRFVR
jgi:hypothetical protein